jgi:maltose-binding protein MalE
VIYGFSGRLVSVTSTSRNAASAFKLLPWITSGSTGTQLSQRSKATLWCRASQVAQAEKWLDGESDDNRTRWLTDMLSRGDAYVLPRIPGIDDYLAELETAITAAVGGEQSALDALTAAEQRWNSITEKLVREQQRIAFHRHLGLSE